MGQSEGTRFSVNSFDCYSADLQCSLLRLKKDLPAKTPIFIYGHSMGALAGMHFISKEAANRVHGVILSAPLLEFGDKIPAWQLLAGRAAVGLIPEFKIKTASNSKRLTRCSLENQKMANDALRATYITLEWFFAAQKASQTVQSGLFGNGTSALWLIPGEDQVVKSSVSEALFAKNAVGQDHEIARFDGMFHELHVELETSRESVFESVVNWLNERCN